VNLPLRIPPSFAGQFVFKLMHVIRHRVAVSDIPLAPSGWSKAAGSFKMVKWLKPIELVEYHRTIGEGHGGYREDFQYYGTGAEI
jgi:hypothetical protein